MKTISIYSLKGGSGKTTLSIIFYQLLVNKGKKVVLIDSDINQRSSIDWAINNTFCEVECYEIDNILHKSDLTPFKDKDFVIIDGTPNINGAVSSFLSLSQDVFIPLAPTQICLSSFLQDKHIQLLKEKKKENPDLKYHIVLNGITPHNIKESLELIELIKSRTGNLINSFFRLGQRKAFIVDYEKSFLDTSNSKALNEAQYILDKTLS